MASLKIITGTDPAANTEISDTVPTDETWRLLAVRFVMVTDATVANRNVTLTFDDGTTVFCVANAGANTALTASATWTLNFAGFGESRAGYAAGSQMPSALPQPLILGPGYRIKTVTLNLQAGDNYGAPIYQVLVNNGRGTAGLL